MNVHTANICKSFKQSVQKILRYSKYSFRLKYFPSLWSWALRIYSFTGSHGIHDFFQIFYLFIVYIYDQCSVIYGNSRFVSLNWQSFHYLTISFLISRCGSLRLIISILWFINCSLFWQLMWLYTISGHFVITCNGYYVYRSRQRNEQLYVALNSSMGP